jgi:dolichyl-diphosphooligosaccharide--protein glycosyltransferase
MLSTSGGLILLTLLRAFGYVSSWTGRFYSLLDPSYAKNHIPIIASVSEHQPTTWSSYMFDLHILAFLFPTGLYYLFRRPTDAGVFLILYGLTSIYFSGVMVRLMLVVAPAACVLAGVAVTETYETYFGLATQSAIVKKSRKGTEDEGSLPKSFAWVIIAGLTILLCFYQIHCTWVCHHIISYYV